MKENTNTARTVYLAKRYWVRVDPSPGRGGVGKKKKKKAKKITKLVKEGMSTGDEGYR